MPRSARPPLAPALAIALASTLPTGSLADCGANARTARASSAGIPRIRSTTRRAFRGVTRTYRAFALASIRPSPSLSWSSMSQRGYPRVRGQSPGQQALTAAAAVIPDMAAERARRGDLPELVADHRLGDEDRHV